MPLPYKQNKTHIYKWREENLEHNKANNRKCSKKYYGWKRISKIYLQILL